MWMFRAQQPPARPAREPVSWSPQRDARLAVVRVTGDTVDASDTATVDVRLR
jgi:hypothetical protein